MFKFRHLAHFIIIILFLTTLSEAQTCPNASDPLCGREIDSWNVVANEPTIQNGNTTFSYTLTKISGALTRFTFGLPSCFPRLDVIETRITPQSSAEILTSHGRTLTNQAPEGFVLKINSDASTFTFEFTVRGIFTKAPVNIGVTATDGCTTCGATKIMYGPKCMTPSSYCGKSLRADIGVMIDQSKFISDNGLKSIRSDLRFFLETFSTEYAENAKIGIGSFYAASSDCPQCRLNSFVNKCTTSYDSFSQNYAYEAGNEYKYANFRSLLTETGQSQSITDFDKDKPYNGYLNRTYYSFDYDGFLRSNYGSPFAPYTNTYRAFLGSSGSGGIFATCGEPVVDAAIKVSATHVMTGWADPQSPNYILLISSGKFTKKIGDNATCGNACFTQEAANAAMTEAVNAKNSGIKVISLLVNDPEISPLLSCPQQELDNGRSTLQQIASDGLFFETSINNFGATLRTIRNALSTTYTCSGSGNGCGEYCNEDEIAGPGGICRPSICPTSTPTPLPTATPTRTPVVTVTTTPTPQISISSQCTTSDVTGTLLAIDTQAHSLERTVRDAARLFEKSVSKSKLAATKRITKSAVQKASKLTTDVWTVNWTQIPGKFTSCNSCVKNLSGSLTSMKSTAGDLAKITDSLLRRVKTKNKIINADVNKLRKRTKNVLDTFVSKISSLPSLTNIC